MKRGRKKKQKALADGEGVLGDLLPKASHPLEVAAEEKRQCTGAYIRAHAPEMYREIIEQLAAGASARELSRLFDINLRTVCAIARIEKLNVAARKSHLADVMLMGSEVFAGRALELAEGCESAYEAAATAKMLAETSNLYRGQATAIHAGVIVKVDASGAAARLAARAAEMGLTAGEISPLALDLTGGPAAIEAETHLVTVTADNKAGVSGEFHADNQGAFNSCPPICHTAPPSPPVEINRGGGGQREPASQRT